MNTLIRNQSDLRAEIFRLQHEKLEKQIALKQHFSSPTAIMSTVAGLISGGGGSDKEVDGKQKLDIIRVVSRFLLPLVLNKTLFKRSGFIIKALVGLASQKASSYISSESVGTVLHKAKGFLHSLLSKKAKLATEPSYKKIRKADQNF